MSLSSGVGNETDFDVHSDFGNFQDFNDNTDYDNNDNSTNNDDHKRCQSQHPSSPPSQHPSIDPPPPPLPMPLPLHDSSSIVIDAVDHHHRPPSTATTSTTTTSTTTTSTKTSSSRTSTCTSTTTGNNHATIVTLPPKKSKIIQAMKTNSTISKNSKIATITSNHHNSSHNTSCNDHGNNNHDTNNNHHTNNDSKKTELSVEEAAALLGASITRISNQSVYRTNTPPLGMHSAFTTVQPVPCSELYHRLHSLHTILSHASNNSCRGNNNTHNVCNNTLAAAPSIVPLLHKLLYISSTLALTPIYLHTSAHTVPLQPLPQQIINNITIATTAATTTTATPPPTTTTNHDIQSINSNDSSSSNNHYYNNNNNNTHHQSSRSIQQTKTQPQPQPNNGVRVPPVTITPPLASKPIRHLWVQCITLAHKLSPPPSSTMTSTSNTNTINNTNNSTTSNASSSSTSTNILAPYLSYATSHPKSAKSSGGTRIASLSVLQHIFQDEILSKRFFNITTSNTTNNTSQLVLQELLTTCFNGLKSSGSNDVQHRIHSMKCLISVFIAYRDNILTQRLQQRHQQTNSNYSNNNYIIHWNDMEERMIQEAIKVLKRASDDKYSEVRLLATQFASVLSTMLLHEKYQYINLSSYIDTYSQNNSSSSSLSSSSSSIFGLTYLDDVCLLCYRNLDDSSIQVSIGWSMALARCMSTAVEYHSFIQQQVSSSTSSSKSNTTSGIDSPTSSASKTNNHQHHHSTLAAAAESSFHQSISITNNVGNDSLASKFKAFNETRKTLNSIASNSCFTLQLAFQFLASQFVRVGHNAVYTGDSGLGGMGIGMASVKNGVASGEVKGSVIDSSRNIRNGIGNTLVQLCLLQCTIGSINIGAESNVTNRSEKDNGFGAMNNHRVNRLDPSFLIMNILLEMVGPAFEHQILTSESKLSASIGSGSGGDINNSGMSGKTPNLKRKSSSAVGSFFGGGGGGGSSNPNSSVVGGSGSRSKKVVCSSSVAGMARLIVGRILRRGLCEMMTETMQLSLLRDFASMITSNNRKWNRHQCQIALVEISHLVSTLGEACASGLDELIPSLQQCFAHSDHGVRYEAAVAFQAVTLAFPSAGRRYIMSMVDEIQVHHDEILALVNNREISSMSSSESTEPVSPSTKSGRRFRRKHEKSSTKSFFSATQISASMHIANEKSLEHQYALHGNSLVLSLVLHIMPKLSGGLPSELLDIILAVADNLISSQGNGVLSQTQPGAIVTCVSAGYRVVSGALTMGVRPTLMHIQKLFGIWAKSAAFIDGDLTRMGALHDVRCLEPFLNSIVVFLRESSELLLSVPDALNRTTQILEKVLPIVMGYSQLESDDNGLTMSSSLDSAKAAIMESFAWLPPGSFPLVADSIFSFASHQIKIGTEAGIPSGLLIDLVTREDDLLEIRSSTHAQLLNQSGGDQMIDDSILTLNAEYVDHSQREAVLHFLEESSVTQVTSETPINDLLIKGKFSDEKLPTPLHQVGTWRKPPTPSKSTKERLMNAAVHVFAATFGLQGGHQQITAIHMLEDLAQSGNSVLSNHVTSVNITAVLLSCLKAIPSSEGSDGVITGTWMSRSARLFFQLLRSDHSLVQRGASEGLGLFASVGVKEDVYTLHNSIMHSLEQMLQVTGNESTMQQKQAFDSVLPKNAGYLFTLGCIHRRLSKVLIDSKYHKAQNLSTVTMLTRLLPFTAIYATEDESLLTRTYVIQSFNMILSHSKMVDNLSSNPEECLQILSKAVEVVENNFYGAWKSNSSELEVKTYEMEKLAYEPSFLVALIRLMSYLLPCLHLLSDGAHVVNRFSCMVQSIMELSNCHPSLLLEGMAFYESMYNNATSMNQITLRVEMMRDAIQMVVPYLKKILAPYELGYILWRPEDSFHTCSNSLSCQLGALYFLEKIIHPGDENIIVDVQGEDFKCALFALLEFVCGSRQFPRSRFPRALACSLAGERGRIDVQLLELKLCQSIMSLSVVETKALPRWLLFIIELISGEFGSKPDVDSKIMGDMVTDAINDARKVTRYSGHTVRWQLKHFAVKVACLVLTSIASACGELKDEDFNLASLRDEYKKSGKYKILLFSIHLKTLLSVACSLCTLTIDQSELYSVQNVGLQFLSLLTEHFSGTRDTDDPSPDAEELVVENFVSQILPAVKHALGACDTDNEEDAVVSEGARDLFINGCNSFCLFVKSNLITEQNTLKRILKQLLPSTGENAFCRYPTSVNACKLHLKPKTFVDNRMSILLPRIGKVSCLAKLCTDTAIGLLHRDLSLVIYDQLVGYEGELAIISAALAIDSFKFQLLLKDDQPQDKTSMTSGLTFPKVQDISVKVQDEMIENWVYFAGFASIVATKVLNEEDEETETFESLFEWLEKLVTIIVNGFRISFDRLNLATVPSSSQEIERTCATCLMALNRIISSKESVKYIVNKDDLCSILKSVLDFLSSLGLENIYMKTRSTPHDDENEMKLEEKTYFPHNKYNITKALVKMACGFLENTVQVIEYDTDMLGPILRPSIFMQEDDTLLNEVKDNTIKVHIFSSYLRSWTHIIRKDNVKVVNEKVIRALFDICINWLRVNQKECLNDALSGLIKCCLEKQVLCHADLRVYANDAARSGYWGIWAILCINNDIQMLLSCSEYMMKSLESSARCTEVPLVLSSLSSVLKEHGDWIADLMGLVGSHLLLLFKMYGTKSYDEKALTKTDRMSICSSIMKILMLSFQFMLLEAGKVSPDKKAAFDASFAEYLTVIFRTLIPVIEFNGLPNQNLNQNLNQNERADSVLGQMCAQFFVHVLRTYPTSFKLCLVALDMNARNILESSVRADISGYAAQPSVPAKKKLKIKTFVSSSRQNA